MVASTRMITQEDCLNSVKKRPGRPTILETRELVVGCQRGASFRQAVNQKYSIHGGALVASITGQQYFEDNFFTARGDLKYQGVFEQIGRLSLDGTISDNDVDNLIREVLDDISSGAKSKEIEGRLRRLRNNLKHYKERS